MAELNSLQPTRDSLRALGVYLLEMAARAQLAGSATLVVQLSNFVGMSSTVMRAVVDIEKALGGATGPTQPSPPAPIPSTGGGVMDPSAATREFAEKLQAYTQELQRQALESLKANAPPPETPAPPVSP